jgi:hypothetical protein
MTKQELAAKGERDMEVMIARYIDNVGGQYTYGGIVNLISTISGAMEKKSKGDDCYSKAAEALSECSTTCDMKYE